VLLPDLGRNRIHVRQEISNRHSLRDRAPKIAVAPARQRRFNPRPFLRRNGAIFEGGQGPDYGDGVDACAGGGEAFED
jgi:hypothetical protein